MPWAACSKEHFALCPNMLLYWETIRTACADGFARFDFGRSTRQSGTYRFKRQWGAQEEPLFWYRIPIASDVDAARRHASCAGSEPRSSPGSGGTCRWRSRVRSAPTSDRYLIQ